MTNVLVADPADLGPTAIVAVALVIDAAAMWRVPRPSCSSMSCREDSK